MSMVEYFHIPEYFSFTKFHTHLIISALPDRLGVRVSNCNAAHVKYEVFAVVKIEYVVSWIVAPCNVVVGHQLLEDHQP